MYKGFYVKIKFSSNFMAQYKSLTFDLKLNLTK